MAWACLPGCGLAPMPDPGAACVFVVAPEDAYPHGFARLQRALDAVPSGAVLTVCAEPPAEPVVVRRPVTILGDGGHLRGIAGRPTLQVEVPSPGRVALAGLVIEAAGGADDPAVRLVASEVEMERGVVRGAEGRGIDAVGGSVILGAVEVEGTGDDGIHAEGASLRLDDVVVRDAGGIGIAVVGGLIDAVATTVSGSAGDGIVVTGGEGSLLGATVEDAGGSGIVGAAATLSLGDVAVVGARRNGIEVEGGALQARDLTVDAHRREGALVGAGGQLVCSGCAFVGGIDGVRASSGSLVSLSASRVEAPSLHGIVLHDDSLGWVKDTTVRGAFVGLAVDGAYSELTATGVGVADSGDAGLVMIAGTVSFLDGVVRGSGADGARIRGGTITIGGATFADNALTGISLAGTTTAQVRATVTGNGEWGLACDGGPGNIVTSSVALQICDLVAQDNGLGPTQLFNGCQQDQPCTVKSP